MILFNVLDSNLSIEKGNTFLIVILTPQFWNAQYWIYKRESYPGGEGAREMKIYGTVAIKYKDMV